MAKAVEAGVLEKDILRIFRWATCPKRITTKLICTKIFVDEITLVSASGKPMKREADLIDVWFDSGSMPYAQWHYPFENKDLIDDGTAFQRISSPRAWIRPEAGFIHCMPSAPWCSIPSPTKMWFRMDLYWIRRARKCQTFGQRRRSFPYNERTRGRCHPLVYDSNANPWDNLKFDIDGIVEVKRKFFGTLYNTYSFFALYANIDEFDYSEKDIPLSERPEIDRWILSELHSLIQIVDAAYYDYEPTRATRAISEYVQENLSIGTCACVEGVFGREIIKRTRLPPTRPCTLAWKLWHGYRHPWLPFLWTVFTKI